MRRTHPFRDLLSFRRYTANGFTIVELLVSLAIIGLLIALLLPAVQQVRAASRKVKCNSNLHQIGVAVHAYTDSHTILPEYRAGGMLWGILPQMEVNPPYDSRNPPSVVTYQCPSDGGDFSYGHTSYAVNIGMFEAIGPYQGFLIDSMKWSRVVDGLSQTAMISEFYRGSVPGGRAHKPDAWDFTLSPRPTIPLSHSQLIQHGDACLEAVNTQPPAGQVIHAQPIYSITAGYTHLLPPNSPRCRIWLVQVLPAWSDHVGGTHVLAADGSTHFVSDSIDREVWLALGSINGHEAIASF